MQVLLVSGAWALPREGSTKYAWGADGPTISDPRLGRQRVADMLRTAVRVSPRRGYTAPRKLTSDSAFREPGVPALEPARGTLSEVEGWRTR